MGTFELEGAVTFLLEKFMQCLNARVLKSGCKHTQIVWKTKMFTIPKSNETAIIPKLAKLKAYIANQSYSINSLNLSKI